MVEISRAVGIVVTLFVAAILAAALMPTAIGSFAGAETATYNQTVGETVELQPGMNATLDSTTAGTSATYTVAAGGDSVTQAVNVGANETVTVDGESVTIGVTEATANYSVASFEYPSTYGWGSAGALWGIMGIMVLLPVLLLFVSRATDTL